MERRGKGSPEEVVRDDLSDGVTFEQRPKGKERTLLTSAGRVFLREGTAYAKAQSQEQ